MPIDKVRVSRTVGGIELRIYPPYPASCSVGQSRLSSAMERVPRGDINNDANSRPGIGDGFCSSLVQTSEFRRID